MIWQTVLDVVDAVESWIAGQSYWVQVVVLLAVLGPLCYVLAGLIDRVVEAVLAWHSRREQVRDPELASTQQVSTEKIGTETVGTETVGTETVGTKTVGTEQVNPTKADR